MESKHTPGKWTTNSGTHSETTELHDNGEQWFSVESEDGDMIAECVHGRCNAIDPQEAEANSRLIAAAPEMYELLQRYSSYEGDIESDVKALLTRINQTA